MIYTNYRKLSKIEFLIKYNWVSMAINKWLLFAHHQFNSNITSENTFTLVITVQSFLNWVCGHRLVVLALGQWNLEDHYKVTLWFTGNLRLPELCNNLSQFPSLPKPSNKQLHSIITECACLMYPIKKTNKKKQVYRATALIKTLLNKK